ncbi:MAG: hypothetical protein HS111_09820 [Kofleriaceae bacterium]|nr:hypothetical protein [Kofleriaceae bacterium]
MSGRLIFPVRATLCRVDPGATAVAPGFDPDFAEPRLVDTDGDGVADVERVELPPIDLLCQVEPKAQEHLAMTAAGDVPRSELTLVFHTRELAARGVYDRSTGTLDLRPGDRLAALRSLAGIALWVPREGRGLYLTEAKLAGWGLGRTPQANLVLATFVDRPAARRVG